MAASLVGGAALGPVFAVFDVLFKTVVDVGASAVSFPSDFHSLKKTLDGIQPVFADIESLNKALDGRDEEIEMFKKQLMEGEELVRRCAETKCYHVLKKWKYTKKLTKFENSLVKFCQMHGLIQVCRDSKEILFVVNEYGKKLDEIHSMLEKCSLRGSFETKNGSDMALQELKVKLLEKNDQRVVLSAPAGYSKTTLAALVCQEDGVKRILRYLIIIVLFASLFVSFM